MKNILVFGDSNTWGFDCTTYDHSMRSGQRLSIHERWSGRLHELLGPDYHVVEDGLCARTSVREDPYAPYRNGLSALRMALDAHTPLDLVVLHTGYNELKHTFNLSAEMIAYGVEMLAKECMVPYYNYPLPKILIIAPAPLHPDVEHMVYGFMYGPEAYKKSLEFSRCYAQTAEYCGSEFMDCADLNFKLNTVDGIHYCKEDHKKLAEAAAAKIRSILEPTE